MSADPKKRPIDEGKSQLPRDALTLWDLLDFAPVSLWLEDWSRVRQTLNDWRAAGISDPVAYAAGDPAKLEVLARAFRVVDVNATSVTVYAAPDKASLIADFERHVVDTIGGTMRNFFIDAIRAFEDGKHQIDIEAWDRRFDGQMIRVHISVAIAPTDKKWERAVIAIKDVTEAWHARAAVDASRDLLTQAAGLARLAHWIRDGATGRVMHCGEEIAGITGRTAGEWATLAGSAAIEACIAPDDRANYREIVPAAVAAGKPYSIEYRLWQPDGTERWVRERGAPLRQASATTTRYISTLQDITEQRLAEAARRSVEAQFQGFLENAPFAMFVKDRERRYTYANRQTMARLGRPLEEIIGHRPDEMFSAEALEVYRKEDDQVLATGAPVIQESRVLGPTGEIWAELIRFPILDEAGAVRSIGGMAIDITEIKRAEQALREQHEFLRLIIDSAAAYIIVFDGVGKIVAANKAYQEFCGVSAEELARDDGWVKTVLPEDLAKVRKTIAPDDPGKFPNHDITRGLRADGDIRLVHWVNAALTEPNGRIKNIICIGTDITEQHRAEVALRESEARLKAFMDNAPFEMVLKDRQGRYVMANEHVAKTVGLSLERLLGRRITELRSDPSAHSYASHDRAVIESGAPISRHMSSIGPDGVQWAQDIKFPIRNADGEIVGLGGIGLDITERKRAEQALRTNEARWRAFKDNAPFFIFYKDLEGRYLDVNRQGALYWKRSFEEIVGHTTAEIQRTGEGEKYIEQDQEVVRTGQPVTREFHSPGDPLGEWFRDLKFPILDQSGEVVAIGGIGMDITDVKRAQQAMEKSEANLRAVVENIVEGIVIFDAEGAIRSVSKAAERMLGYRAYELTERDLGTIFPRFAAALSVGAGNGFLEALESSIGKSQEFEALARDGQRLTVAFSVNELPPSNGVRHFVGTILDLTPHKLLEDRLRQAQKMETIGQFTGGIAHDFNNLLAVIIGNLDLLAARSIDERARKLVDRASGAAQRGADLTQRLLAFSRRQRLEPEPVDVAAFIRDTTPLVTQTLGPTVQLKHEVAADSWSVLVDRAQLEAALINLMSNARDAMPKGGELTIRTTNRQIAPESSESSARLRPGRYVEIAVADNGAGMEPDVAARAFEPFFTTKGVGQGTGLGLSMVHGFAQQSEGDVRLSSTPGVGTTVFLYLPATEPPVEQVEGETREPVQVRGPGRRILVVDDEPEVLMLVKDLLGGLGYRVDTAGNGAEALEQLKRPVVYDLLLTDVRMKGGMSGPQLAAAAKIGHPDMKVLYMSGFDDTGGRDGGVPKGANLLHKPFRPNELALSVVRLLGD